MRTIKCLVVLLLLCNANCARANWRDDNPNQPNGYAASMYRYHHGTPDDDGPHDGYRASEFRARNGLDRFAPPSEDDSSSVRGGGGRLGSESGLGRHFRQGQAESQAFWQNRMRTQMQSQLRSAAGVPTGQSMYMAPGFSNQSQPRFQSGSQQQQSLTREMPLQRVSMPRMPMRQMPMQQMVPTQVRKFPPAYSTRVINPDAPCGQAGEAGALPQPAFPSEYTVPMSESYHYAPNSTAYSNSSALRSAVMQHPVGSLLRNSQGGFNRIYSPQQY